MKLDFVKSDDEVVFSTSCIEEEENRKMLEEEERRFESLDYSDVDYINEHNYSISDEDWTI